MPYADYTYYAETYQGTMPEEDFNRLSRQASAYLAGLTFRRTDKPQPDVIVGRIKDACCAVADVLLEKENGGEVKSQTVGSWAKSFSGSGKTMDAKQFEAAALYLTDTGLLYRGGRE